MLIEERRTHIGRTGSHLTERRRSPSSTSTNDSVSAGAEAQPTT